MSLYTTGNVYTIDTTNFETTLSVVSGDGTPPGYTQTIYYRQIGDTVYGSGTIQWASDGSNGSGDNTLEMTLPSNASEWCLRGYGYFYQHGGSPVNTPIYLVPYEVSPLNNKTVFMKSNGTCVQAGDVKVILTRFVINFTYAVV